MLEAFIGAGAVALLFFVTGKMVTYQVQVKLLRAQVMEYASVHAGLKDMAENAVAREQQLLRQPFIMNFSEEQVQYLASMIIKTLRENQDAKLARLN
jgi:uncharacterized protein YfeS